MATGKQVIAEAKKHLGEKGTTFWAEYGTGAVDWCCIFVWYVLRQCGASNLFYDGDKVAWVPSAQEWLAKNATKVSIKDAKAGDIVIFTWGGGSRDHIGFAINPINSKRLQTIEGNTGSSVCTTSTVQIRERTASVIYGIYRPKYEEKKAVKKTSFGEIRKYQCIKTAHVYQSYSVASGRIGKDTSVGSVYSATAWANEWLFVPFLDGWVPTSGSGGIYLERVEKITYIITNISGANVYTEHTTKSKYMENVSRGSQLTLTKWYGGWGYAPSVKGWVAMSCLTEVNAGAMLFREMEKIARQFKKLNMKYSIENLRLTLAGALADKRVDCAHYVSFGLQAMGVLDPGEYIWLNNTINGNGARTIRGCGKVTISYPNKLYTELNLKIGDVVGYGYTGGQHTQVFAGYDSKGYPLWYSAGTSDVKGKAYGPKRKITYEDRPINVLIRLK